MLSGLSHRKDITMLSGLSHRQDTSPCLAACHTEKTSPCLAACHTDTSTSTLFTTFLALSLITRLPHLHIHSYKKKICMWFPVLKNSSYGCNSTITSKAVQSTPVLTIKENYIQCSLNKMLWPQATVLEGIIVLAPQSVRQCWANGLWHYKFSIHWTTNLSIQFINVTKNQQTKIMCQNTCFWSPMSRM